LQLERALRLWENDNIDWFAEPGKRTTTLTNGTKYTYLKPALKTRKGLKEPGTEPETEPDRGLVFGVNWSSVTKRYIKTIRKSLKPDAMEKIAKAARSYAKDTGRASRGTGVVSGDVSSDDDDPRAFLVDRSEPEDNCKC
jgi:hypothetical protein